MQISIDDVKNLDQRLFETYIELKSDPIVGSLEPGIYAGYFDWKDCLTPTGMQYSTAVLLQKKKIIINLNIMSTHY